MTSSLVQVNYLLLKLNRKLIKMFLNLKRESNPQPSDLRCGWDTIYLTASHFIYIYGKLSVAKRRRLLSLFDPHSPFISLLWEWCSWAGLDASHLQVSLDRILEPETGATSLPITKRQLGVDKRICFGSLSDVILVRCPVHAPEILSDKKIFLAYIYIYIYIYKDISRLLY